MSEDTRQLAEIDPERSELASRFEVELEEYTKANGADVPTFFLSKVAEFKALREQIRKQADILLGHVAAREKALQWVLGGQFRTQVEADLKAQGGKKRSVDYLTGRAGHRAQPDKFTILDEPALKAWCLEHCDDALELKIQRTTPIKDHIKSTGEVPPGSHWAPGADKFYPTFDQIELANESEKDQ